MDIMMVMFQELVNPEQKELSALVTAKGGVKALRNDDKVLRSLEEAANKASSTSSAEGHRAPHAKANDEKHAEDIKTDIFEDPGAAVEKNLTVFFRKFEAQKNQIAELTLVIKRETDRVIQEVNGGPHERLLDRVSSLTPYSFTERMPITFPQSIHEIWKEMVDFTFPSIS